MVPAGVSEGFSLGLSPPAPIARALSAGALPIGRTGPVTRASRDHRDRRRARVKASPGRLLDDVELVATERKARRSSQPPAIAETAGPANIDHQEGVIIVTVYGFSIT